MEVRPLWEGSTTRRTLGPTLQGRGLVGTATHEAAVQPQQRDGLLPTGLAGLAVDYDKTQPHQFVHGCLHATNTAANVSRNGTLACDPLASLLQLLQDVRCSHEFLRVQSSIEQNPRERSAVRCRPTTKCSPIHDQLPVVGAVHKSLCLKARACPRRGGQAPAKGTGLRGATYVHAMAQQEGEQQGFPVLPASRWHWQLRVQLDALAWP